MMLTHKPTAKIYSLKNTTFLAFVLSFFLPSFLLITLLFAFFIRISYETQEKESQNTLNILSSHLVNNINASSSLSLSYLFDSEISSFYFFLNKKPYTDDLYQFNRLSQSYTSTLNTRMTLIGDSILGVGFIPHLHNNELLFYLKKYNQIQLEHPGDYTQSDWYHQLVKNNQTTLFLPSQTAQTPNSISLIRCVKNVDKRQVVGYLFQDISLDFIFEPLKEMAISPDSGILLASPKDVLLFSTNEELTKQVQSQEENASFSKQLKNYDVYSYTDDSYGFTFYYYSSRTNLYRSYFTAFALVLLFYLGMLFLAAAIFTLVSRLITRSIDPILTTMDRYNAGDSKIQCDTAKCSVQEISAIAVTLNQMIQKINTHIDNEYKFQMEQKIAEYQALQSEINPHFLHNILNLLIALNRLNDKVSLENSIVSLSRLFRYTCEHNYNSTIQQEFDFIKDYLYLQKIRFEERLSFTIYVEPGLEDFQIPKLLVQPLIENAIVHGLDPSDQKETITLSAFTLSSKNNGDFTAITVVNTGLPYIENKSYKRIGLKNIEERLSIFAPDSFFLIRGGLYKPTKCTILIPKRRTL